LTGTQIASPLVTGDPVSYLEFLVQGWIAIFVASIAVIERAERNKSNANSWQSRVAISFVALSVLIVLGISFVPREHWRLLDSL
jgi:hypothetical protein